MFIDSRFGRRDTANLIASGPSGQVHFWNIYKNGVLMAKFRPVKQVLTAEMLEQDPFQNKDRITTVTQVKLDLTCRLLFVADSLGKRSNSP